MRRWDPVELPERAFAQPFETPISRAQALRRGAAATAALAGLGLVNAVPAMAAWGSQPRPIPGGFDQNFNLVPSDPFIHVLPPYYGLEMSTITNFHGVLAAGEIQGLARGSDGVTYGFDADMRFMRGTYIGLDGHSREGSFGFI